MQLITGTSAAAALLALGSNFFLRDNLFSGSGGTSKRHPVGDPSTGPEAAMRYRMRRNISASHGSSLRKLDRENRIYNGDAPLKHDVPGRREVKIMKREAARAKCRAG